MTLVHDSIAIEVSKPHHATDRIVLAGPVGVGHVSPHLKDPEVTIRIETRLHGIADHRFRNDQFDAMARLDPHRVEGCTHIERRSWIHSPCFGKRTLNFTGAITVLGRCGIQKAGGDRDGHGDRDDGRASRH